MDEDGHLTFKEFTVAMHLLFIAKLGYFLPVDLDPNTILPPRVSIQQCIRHIKFYDVSGCVCVCARRSVREG